METQQNLYMTLGKIGLLVLMAFGILLFLRSILKPKREKQFVEEIEDIEEPPMPQVEDLISNDMTAEDIGRAEAAMGAKKREMVRREVMDIASRNPENIAQIIKKWLSEE